VYSGRPLCQCFDGGIEIRALQRGRLLVQCGKGDGKWTDLKELVVGSSFYTTRNVVNHRRAERSKRDVLWAESE
jgi:hypothetical protein